MSKFVKVVCTMLSIICLLTSFSVYLNVNADKASQFRSDISRLKQEAADLQSKINKLSGQKSDQSAVLAVIQQKIANTQAQINRCNQEIYSINSKISQNKAEIKKKNDEIAKNKLTFKKRIRAIYMSNSDSNVRILLGAESFSDYLQLSQLVSAVSSHDKAIIEDIVAAVKILNAKMEENEKLLNEQVSIKSSIVSQQQQLKAEEDKAQAIYNSISSTQNSIEKDKKNVEAEIKEKQSYLDSLASAGGNYGFVNTNSGFRWPVPYTTNITSGYGARWGTIHRGIDISSGGIFGKPIVAIADGYVYDVYSGCGHTSRSSHCRCGSGWGNHVSINHGTVNGSNFKAIYAHMNTVAASNGQFVKQGQVIGYVGTTGDSYGYHLHLSIIKDGCYVNPYPYFFN